ncbi:MAG TPA: HEAT repeat domain-containing protein [Acidobacteriaceae bacterium]|jgi:HEAT repeat protein
MTFVKMTGPRSVRAGLVLALVCLVSASGWAQVAATKGQDTSGKGQTAPATADGQVTGDVDAPTYALPKTSTPEDRAREAWTILTEAIGDTKHAQVRTQGLAALGLLRAPRSSKMIADSMIDPDVDVRVAAVLAAGQTQDRNLTTNLRNLLDDAEPQVAFAAATTLWKMNDRSGEDVLLSVASGDRSTNPSVVHGTEHKINKDLHDPGKLAKLGAMQAGYMLLGPFGYGIAAFQFMRQSGGNYARAAAIEQIAQEKTEPIHKELLSDLEDKDQIVRAAATKGLMDYRDKPTSMAIYALFADPKYPVRLTAAAAYLRTTGTPGPPVAAVARASSAPRKH